MKFAAGRTLRELFLILGGAVIVAGDVIRPGGPDVGNLIVYAVATALFVTRFYMARAVAVGACIGALAQQWPSLRFGLAGADVWTLGLLPLAGIALLASRDLVERFDRAPSRARFLPNPWAGFTAAQVRGLRWCGYAAGALAGLLDHTLQLAWHDVTPWWPRLAMIGLTMSLALLVLGRAVGLAAVWAIALMVCLLVLPDVVAAEAYFSGDMWVRLSPLYWGGVEYVLPIFLLASAAALTATPYTLRLLRRTLLE